MTYIIKNNNRCEYVISVVTTKVLTHFHTPLHLYDGDSDGDDDNDDDDMSMQKYNTTTHYLF